MSGGNLRRQEGKAWDRGNRASRSQNWDRGNRAGRSQSWKRRGWGGPESGSREPDRQRPDGPEPGAWERSLRRRGTALAAFVVLAAAAVSGTVLLAAYQAAPALGAAVEAWMTYQILALKCLKTESGKVYDRLVRGTLAEARRAVSMIVGRDTDALDDAAVTRAAVETVAENTSDGVIAPMLCLALGGPVLGFAYKAVNTMDSMIGYKNERYLDFGRTAARMDDAVNWIPARLSALLMTAAAYLLGREFDGKNAWRIWRRDRPQSRQPQFRPDRGCLRRSPGDPSGGRRQLFRQGGEKAHYRRRRPAGGGRGYPAGPPAFIWHSLAVPGVVPGGAVSCGTSGIASDGARGIASDGASGTAPDSASGGGDVTALPGRGTFCKNRRPGPPEEHGHRNTPERYGQKDTSKGTQKEAHMHGGDIYRNQVTLDFSVNINPLGMPESVRQALRDAVEDCTCYPDERQEALRAAIGAWGGSPLRLGPVRERGFRTLSRHCPGARPNGS